MEYGGSSELPPDGQIRWIGIEIGHLGGHGVFAGLGVIGSQVDA